MLIIRLQFKSKIFTGISFSSVVLSWSGGFIMMWLFSQEWFLNFHFLGSHLREVFQIQTIYLSVAVWVGFLALFGIATDDGVLISTNTKSEVEKNEPKIYSNLLQL